MEAHRIAVISDTHGILRPEVLEQIRSCEMIFHGGDVGKPEILGQLRAICPLYAVRGNVDEGWAGELPAALETELFGFRIYMIHNIEQAQKNLSDYDIVIYGHSHKYEEKESGRTMYLNPGSCGRRRFFLPLTLMILTLYPAEHRIKVEKIDCAPAARTASAGEDPELSRKDMHRLIRTVIKGVDAGMAVGDIAARSRMDEKLAEQICRMYVTHPSVDVDGIINRIDSLYYSNRH